MRPIKFRAWDKLRKEYFHITQLWNDGTQEDGYAFEGWQDNYGNTGYLDTVVLEQYTGVKDKYCKEIYEGDIVHRQGDYYTSDVTGKVIFEEGTYKAKGIDKTSRVPHTFKFERVAAELAYLNQQELEVLGNIHENPELLEQS